MDGNQRIGSLLLLLAVCSSLSAWNMRPVYGQIAAVKQELATAKAAYLAKDFGQAEVHYTKAIALGAQLPAASKIVLWTNLGAALREAHKYAESDAAFNKAMALAAGAKLNRTIDYVGTLKQYALLLRKMHNQDKAEQIDQLAMKILNPDGVEDSSVGASSADKPVIDQQFDPSSVSNQAPPGAGELSMEQLMVMTDQNPRNSELLRFTAASLYRQNDYGHCINYAQKALALEPDSEALLSMLSVAKEQMGQTEEAVAYGKRAIAVSPSARNYYNMVYIYSNAGDMANQLKSIKEFIARFPNDGNTPHLQKTLTKLENATAETDQTALGGPTAEEQQQCWKGRVEMPLKYYFADNTNADMTLKMKNGTGARRPGDLVQDALDSWSKASYGRISFERVSDQDSAQIIIGYSYTTDAVLSENGAAGVTQWNPDRSHAIIHLGLVDKQGNSIDRGQFFSTTLHELGHALGLDHSKRPDDVMFWQQHSIEPTAPSRVDQQRLLTLYGG